MEKKSENYIAEVYNNASEYFLDIATSSGQCMPLKDSVPYDLTGQGKPSIAEAKYAFYNWNCAIITAFRGAQKEDLEKWKAEGLSEAEIEEKNFEKNCGRNEELKNNLRQHNLLFRTVDGWYKEYGKNKYVKELSMFVTNCDTNGNVLNEENFFKKIYQCAENYEQDCFLFTFRGGSRIAFLIATNDAGRKDYRNDVHFAGPLYTTQIGELDSWTQFEDGKLSFMLKGMILRPAFKNILIGNGDLFDTEGYNPDGLVVICENEQKSLKKSCNQYDGDAPLVKRYFLKENQTKEDIEEKVISALNTLIRDNKIARKKKLRIGFHCSANIDGSSTKAAKEVIETIKKWAERKRIKKRLDSIVLVDLYGDYSRVINTSK